MLRHGTLCPGFHPGSHLTSMPTSESGSRTRGSDAGFAGRCSCRASHTSQRYFRASSMASSEAF
eukprot:8844196-Lingulodinium_polyedra.AAC.1